MRIEIDTKEDLHNIHHIIRLLQSISGNKDVLKSKNIFEETPSTDIFSDSSSSLSTTSSDSSSSTSLFNMFGDSSSTTITEKKDDEPKSDYLDSIQMY